MKHKPTTIRLSFCIYGDYFDVDKVTNIVDFIISLSLNESWYHFDIERFAAKNRGGGRII